MHFHCLKKERKKMFEKVNPKHPDKIADCIAGTIVDLAYKISGEYYRRITWNNICKKSNVCRCCTGVDNGLEACNAPTVKETELQEAKIKALNFLIRCSLMNEIFIENISKALAYDNSGEFEEINITLKVKQKELVKLFHAKKDYNILADEIDELIEFAMNQI